MNIFRKIFSKKEKTIYKLIVFIDSRQMFGIDDICTLENIKTLKKKIKEIINIINRLKVYAKPYINNAKLIEIKLFDNEGVLIKKFDITNKILNK